MNNYKNPIDFTPRKVYEEMDRQAELDREEKVMILLSTIIGLFIGMALMIYILKHI